MDLEGRITQLVAEQKTVAARKRNLLVNFRPLREHLMNTLHGAIGHAIEQGLTGLKQFEGGASNPHHDKFALNGINITWVSNDQILTHSAKRPLFAAKILFYHEDQSADQPEMEITYCESFGDQGRIVCSGTAFNTPKPENFFTLIPGSDGKSETEIVRELFEWYYGLIDVWPSQPTLESIQTNDNSKTGGQR